MVEHKVKWSTLATFAAGLAVAILNALQDNPGALDPLPKWAQGLILALAPALVAFLAGYRAPHTTRYVDRTRGGSAPATRRMPPDAVPPRI